MNEDIKKLEKQRQELENKIKQYYAEEERERVKLNEEKYVGKCYKIEKNGSTIYMKIISGLTNNTYCYMHCMKFKLPIEPKFKPVLRMNNNNKFEYEFMGDVLEFDNISIKQGHYNERSINKYVEISTVSFENALKEFGKQLLELSREDFTLNSKYFRD